MACLLHGLQRTKGPVPLPGTAARQKRAGSRERQKSLSAQGQQIMSSPSLGSAALLDAQGGAVQQRKSRKRREQSVPQLDDMKALEARALQPLPYACSEVMSVRSLDIADSFIDRKPGEEFKRGLLRNDLTYAHNNTPGVCVMKDQKLPAISCGSAADTRVKAVTAALQQAIATDAKARERHARPPSPGGSSQGDGGEMLFKQMRMSAGKPSLTRRIPEGDEEKLNKHYNAPDSMFASEQRAQFWWKNLPEIQKHELKKNVFPTHTGKAFREAAEKAAAVCRQPVYTY